MSFDWPIFSSFIVFLHICGAAAAAHAIMSTRSSQSAVAWAISLALIPYFTLLPYLLFGLSRLTPRPSMISNHNQSHHQPIIHQNLTTPSLDLYLQQSHLSLALPQQIQALSKLSCFPITTNNTARLLINGEETFNALLNAISQARQTIFLQSFTIQNDVLGMHLQALLCERAQMGVNVYFLYDSIGSHRLPRHYIQTLKKSGVHTQAFSAGRSFHNPLKINFRNHRKLTIIDNCIAFLGGLNIGSTYIDAHPRLCPWRDTHIEIKGPVVNTLQMSFTADWFWMTSTLPQTTQHLQKNQSITTIDSLTNQDLCKKRTFTYTETNHMLCQALPSGPADHQETCLLFFVEAINSARQRIWLTSPYFIPNEAIRTALQLAVLRGVEVRLLLPSMADHYTVYAASSLYAYDIIRAGVKVYRYQPGFMHQKVVLIDETIAAIGSANLDNRSFHLNFELTLITISSTFAKQVETMLEKDFKQSTLISIDEYQNASLWKKFAMHVAKLFSPIL